MKPKKTTNLQTWAPADWSRTARALPRAAVLAAADAAGLLAVNAQQLGRRAGVSNRAAGRWLSGIRVSSATDRAIREALGLSVAA